APVTRTARPLIRSPSEATWALLTASGAARMHCPAIDQGFHEAIPAGATAPRPPPLAPPVADGGQAGFSPRTWAGADWGTGGGDEVAPAGTRRVTISAPPPTAADTATAAAMPSGRFLPAPAATAAPPTPMPSAVPSTSARFSDADARPSRPGD